MSSVMSFATLLHHFCLIIIAKCWLVVLAQAQLEETGEHFGVYVFVLNFFETLDKEGQVIDTNFLPNFCQIFMFS